MTIKDPYKAGKFATNPYAKKTSVAGPLVVVLAGQMDNRDLALPPFPAALRPMTCMNSLLPMKWRPDQG